MRVASARLDGPRAPAPHALRRRHGRPADEAGRVVRLREAHTPRCIPPTALELIGQGVSVAVATRDAAMRPHIARAWGPEVLDPPRGPLRLCVDAPEGSAPAVNLTERPEIAVIFARPSTYQSVQLKGLTLEVRTPTERELEVVDQHQLAFSADVQKVGLQLRLVRRLVNHSSLVSVVCTVDELYDQTPGAAAGAPL